MSHDIPQRLFLDTNIYIIGVANQNSYERKILASVGFIQPSSVEIIISEELLDQILRVSKRLYNKDWGSQIVALATGVSPTISVASSLQAKCSIHVCC